MVKCNNNFQSLGIFIVLKLSFAFNNLIIKKNAYFNCDRCCCYTCHNCISMYLLNSTSREINVKYLITVSNEEIIELSTLENLC